HVAVEEAPLDAVHAVQPLGPALGAEEHLLLEVGELREVAGGRQGGRLVLPGRSVCRGAGTAGGREAGPFLSGERGQGQGTGPGQQEEGDYRSAHGSGLLARGSARW